MNSEKEYYFQSPEDFDINGTVDLLQVYLMFDEINAVQAWHFNRQEFKVF